MAERVIWQGEEGDETEVEHRITFPQDPPQPEPKEGEK